MSTTPEASHPHRFAVAVSISLILGCSGPTPISLRDDDFLGTRAANGMALTVHGPSPQQAAFPVAPPGATVVVYTGPDGPLPALMHVPDAAQLSPGVVYVHGGFGMDGGDYEACAPFVDANYALLVPTWRGEDGNPGEFEMMGGELDDLGAAIAWFRTQPGVDPEHIYVFGHSVGGNLAAMYSLVPSPGVRLTGSAGGLYSPSVFDDWAGAAPFDLRDPTARDVRLFGPWLGHMLHPHIAYVGDADPARKLRPAFEKAAIETGAPLRIESVPGSHGASLDPAMRAFLEEIKHDRASEAASTTK